jgi:hypothetical protein
MGTGDRPNRLQVLPEPALTDLAPAEDDLDDDQADDGEGRTRGVVALLEWAPDSDRPAVVYLSSSDSPATLAGLVQYVLQGSDAVWDDPGLFAAVLVDHVASSGAPFRLSALEPDFDGRMLEVDVEDGSMAIVATGQPGRRWRSWTFEELATTGDWCQAFEAS